MNELLNPAAVFKSFLPKAHLELN